MKRFLRLVPAAFFCAALLFLVDGYAANAVVTDLSGHSYEVASVRLRTGSKLKVVCGESRMDVPFKSVSSMKIDPARISSVDGRPHYGVEIRLSGGAVLGAPLEDGGNCVVCADNGIKGKSSKVPYNAPFRNLSGVRVLGKGENEQTGRSDDDDEDGDEE